MGRLTLFFVAAAMMATLVSSQTANQDVGMQQMLPLWAMMRHDSGNWFRTMMLYNMYSGGANTMFTNPLSWMLFPRLMGNT